MSLRKTSRYYFNLLISSSDALAWCFRPKAWLVMWVQTDAGHSLPSSLFSGQLGPWMWAHHWGPDLWRLRIECVCVVFWAPLCKRCSKAVEWQEHGIRGQRIHESQLGSLRGLWTWRTRSFLSLSLLSCGGVADNMAFTAQSNKRIDLWNG